MRIAYCSPFNPIKSGISDFNEELLMELKKFADIDLFYNVQPSKQEILDNFAFYNIEELYKDSIRSKYDTIVYHMGNNVEYHKCIAETFMQFPGILELHDFSLHNYLAGDTYVRNDVQAYVEGVRYSHGEKGVKIVQKFIAGQAKAPWETHSLELTVNKHLIDRAKGVIVHSDMAKQMVKGIRPEVPVINIPLHTPDILADYEVNKIEAKKKLNIDGKTYVFGSFGYATRAKRIIETLEALGMFYKKVTKDFHYFIVGKVDGIDVESKIQELSIQDNVTVTGFTELEDFKTYMSACDICINLRYPTHGESSASLHRMLGMGKAVIVSNIGSFDEYPDEIVLKVRCDCDEITDIYNALCELTNNSSIMKQRNKSAFEYANKYCNLEMNACKYFEFYQNVCNNSFIERGIDYFIDKLFELNIVEEHYIDYLINVRKINKIIERY
ncbi:glycosyltransferase [Anaerocolumna sp. AGMB13025]|uniref:glycosyltransferase n=1 Tax=Anaerocolumna sp. AGMB13025 TaxID=3039116 RepID=UPI00241D020E|nr:glycosyltransferase [Anaerocolumna sp. AGMB13025]WFR56316.1 glycosyltransferase [Anaerocolumna sp. AGMB13025]